MGRATLLVLAACGRLGLTTPPPDAASSPPMPVQVATRGGVQSPVTVMLDDPVAAGDLLVVALAIHTSAAALSVTEGSSTALALANRATMGNTASELWYLANAAPASTVKIVMSQTTGLDVWVVELANVATVAPLDATAGQCLPYMLPMSPIAVADVATTKPDELAIGVTMLSGGINVTTVAAPFTAFGALSGNGAAFYVAPTAGSYGPMWSATATQSGVTCSSTASFLTR
jgi:hypothetical protein